MSKGSPVKLAQMAAGRKMSARHQRRAAEAEAEKQARKELQGMSIPQAKKLLRRRKRK